jgi:hypothetical protein
MISVYPVPAQHLAPDAQCPGRRSRLLMGNQHLVQRLRAEIPRHLGEVHQDQQAPSHPPQVVDGGGGQIRRRAEQRSHEVERVRLQRAQHALHPDGTQVRDLRVLAEQLVQHPLARVDPGVEVRGGDLHVEKRPGPTAHVQGPRRPVGEVASCRIRNWYGLLTNMFAPEIPRLYPPLRLWRAMTVPMPASPHSVLRPRWTCSAWVDRRDRTCRYASTMIRDAP